MQSATGPDPVASVLILLGVVLVNPHPARIWPEGRMQRPLLQSAWPLSCLCCCFNPHPAFWPDATVGPRPRPRFHWCPRPEVFLNKARSPVFQSSSGLLAGCNSLAWLWNAPCAYGFNPHPAFWPDATAVALNVAAEKYLVSILIRPSGRMQQSRFRRLADDRDARFNPHPAFWPDATGARP